MKFRSVAWVLAIAAGLGGFASGQAIQNDRLNGVRHSTAEVAAILSSQLRADLDHLIRILKEIGEGKLKPLHQEVLAARDGKSPDLADSHDRFHTSEYEFDRDFLDVSLWRRPEGSAKPRRLYVALNTQHVTPVQSVMLRGPDMEAIEADLIQPAFAGQVVVTLGTPNEWGGFALVAVPMGQESAVSDVIVAHIRLSRFQRIFRWDAPTRAAVVNADGWILAQSGHRPQEIRESLGFHPILQAMRADSSRTGGDSLEFEDSHGVRHLGAYRTLNLGRLAVIATIPAQEALPGPYAGQVPVVIGLLFAVVILLSYSAGRGGLEARAWLRAPRMPRPGGHAAEPLESALAGDEAEEPTLSFVSPSLSIADARAQRWLVNNGSQIIGPLTAGEVARRLFAQELDFDCECWKENGGNPSSIRESGMFTGSVGDGADTWVYDGQTIHGPCSARFVRTALLHGALSDESHACEGTTVNGWKVIKDWLPVQSEAVEAEPVSRTEDSPEPAPAVASVSETAPDAGTEKPPELQEGDPAGDCPPSSQDPDGWRSAA